MTEEVSSSQHLQEDYFELLHLSGKSSMADMGKKKQLNIEGEVKVELWVQFRQCGAYMELKLNSMASKNIEELKEARISMWDTNKTHDYLKKLSASMLRRLQL